MRGWITRAYPVAFLLGVVVLHGRLSDRGAAFAFAAYRSRRTLEHVRDGTGTLTMSMLDDVSLLLDGAVHAQFGAASSVRWMLLAGVFGYALLARESRRFRLGVVGLICLTISAQFFLYPIY